MNVLVVGGAGYVGGVIVDLLLEKKNYRFLFSSFLYLKFLIIYFLISSINFKDNTYFTIKNIFLLFSLII